MKAFENKTQQEAFNEWSEKLVNMNKPVEKIQELLEKAEKNISSSDNYELNYRIGKIEALKYYINSKN